MKTKSKIISLCSGKSTFIKYSFLIGCLIVTLTGKAQQTTLAVIGNTSGVPAEMKQSELKSVLMGETQRWKNGKRVLIALMKTNTPIGKTTSSKVYDMSGDELNKYWLSLVFQGKSQAPVFFNSVADLQNYVSQNPGAIGIIDKPLANADIRLITVDGKLSF